MIVVSMAIIDSRVCNVPLILDCLERQTLKPDKVLLYYSQEPWHMDNGFSTPPRFQSSLDVEVIRVPNLGSSRKYLFTAARYRGMDTAILLLDDDLLWSRHLVGLLYYQLQRLGAVTTRGWSEFEIVTESSGQLFRRGRAVEGYKIEDPTQVKVASSGWGTMFKAKDLDDRFFDPALQEAYQISYSDEIFLSAMLRCPKFVIPFAPGLFRKLETPGMLCRHPKTAKVKALQAKLL